MAFVLTYRYVGHILVSVLKLNRVFRYLTFFKIQAFSLWRAARTLPQEEKIRTRSPASQHKIGTQAYPQRPDSGWKHQVPCFAIGVW